MWPENVVVPSTVAGEPRVADRASAGHADQRPDVLQAHRTGESLTSSIR